MRIFKVFFAIIILNILSSCNTSSTADKNNSQSEGEKGLAIETPMLMSSSIDYKESITADKINPVVNNSETGISQYKINKLFAEKNHDDKYKIKENCFYDYFLGKNKNAEKLQHFNINLNALTIKEVVTLFSEILGFNYYFDENINGLVTISINSDLKERTLWEIFEQVLWLSGVYCSLDDGLVHILPFSKMPKERHLLTTFEPKANVSAIMFRLKKSNSSALSKILLPFLTKGAVLIDDSSQNLLLIVDSPSNMPKLASLIKMLDVDNRQNYPKIVIKCVNVPPTYIAKELARILPILGLPLQHINEKGKVEQPGAINIQGIDRMQLLVVSAANLEAIDMVKNWVKALDSSSYGEQNKLFIYKVQSSSAAKLIAALKVVFNVEGTTLSEQNASISSFAGDFSSAGSGQNNSVSNDTGAASSYLVTAFSSNIGSAFQAPLPNLKKQSSALPMSVFENPIRIFADAVNERLMIRTTDRTYSMVKAVLQKIDTPPVQVLVRVVIADIQLKATTNLGVEVKEWINNSGLKYEINNNYDLYDSKNPTEGFNFLISDWNNPAEERGFLNALATDGVVKLLAKPEILVKNNSQASMFVGSQVPIINQTPQATSESKDPQSDLMVSQDVTYQEVGLILNVTPSVTQGGLVNINIDQNISNIDSNTNLTSSAANGLAPSIQTTRIITTFCLPDNATIIIGGLIRSDKQDTLSTIPFINNIPILNRLFGSTVIINTRNELLIMLSVKIVHQTTPQEEMLNRYTAAAKLIKKGLHTNVNNSVILNLSGNKTNKVVLPGFVE